VACIQFKFWENAAVAYYGRQIVQEKLNLSKYNEMTAFSHHSLCLFFIFGSAYGRIKYSLPRITQVITDIG
jgi:hypothetical protein